MYTFPGLPATMLFVLTVAAVPARSGPPAPADRRLDVNGRAPSVSVPIPIFDPEKPETWEREWAWFNRFGGTLASSGRRSNAEHRRYREQGIETMAMPFTPARNARQDRDGRYWITTYLKSPWQTIPAGGGAPVFSLDVPQDPHGHAEAWNYVFAAHLDPGLTVHVQAESSRAWLPREAWTLNPDEKTVTVTGGEPGESYRVLFLCGEQFADRGMNIDGIPAGGRRQHMEHLEAWLDALPDLSIVRPTSFCYIFSIVNPWEGLEPPYPAVPLRCWYGYQRTTTPDRLARFERRYGYPFDIRLMTDTCYLDEGYPPTEDTRRWIDLVREDLNGYVKDYVGACHARGKRVRMFWGDQWIGVEPYLGDVEAGGIDEIVTALHGGPGRVRDLMSFPGRTKRFARFTLIGDDTARHAARARSLWRQWKAEMLVACPDGLEFLVMREAWLNDRQIARAYLDIAEDFKRVFHHTHGRERRKPMTMVALNAWGGMRSLGRHDYVSRRLFSNMVDWPADLRFERLDVVARDGVPPDADLVILYGEPGTAWSGAGLWEDPRLADAIRAYVQAGGGLLCAGGGAGYHDGRFVLSDLAGVAYDGAPSPSAAAGLWNRNRWNEAGQPPDGFDDGTVMPVRTLALNRDALPEAVAARCGTTELSLQADCRVRATGATVFAASEEGDVVCTLAQRGKGRVAYLGGYGSFPRLLKVLCYYLGDKTAELDRLDTGNADVLPFFYPEGNRLVLYNRGAAATVALRFDAALAGLAQCDRIALTPADGGKPVFVNR
ncbi:MAG: hypothetical protein JW951_10325, partial [Lentisphaerae bacterium]|nr:hypothetical protein [Lentisphaerota bacterium]